MATLNNWKILPRCANGYYAHRVINERLTVLRSDCCLGNLIVKILTFDQPEQPEELNNVTTLPHRTMGLVP